MTRIATIVGARPQFIKAAAVSRVLRSTREFTETLIHTGQHYDHGMSDIFFKELELPKPEFNLGIGSGPHGEQTGRMLGALEQTLLSIKPDWVLVYGDTNSTLAGALAAIKLHMRTAHVEAGLRSFNRSMPEEINRILVDQCSDLLLAPTIAAVSNLRNEGNAETRIKLVGDVMYDAALYYGNTADRDSTILERLQLKPKGYILATVHRAGNTDDPRILKGILDGLSRSTELAPVIFPIHPRTLSALNSSDTLKSATKGLQIIDPVGYIDMIQLEKNARVIATDSGGVQKEAFFYRVPCVTLRDETEWVETVQLGANQLAGSDSDSIHRCIGRASQLGATVDPADTYGGGDTSMRIAELLRS